MSPKLSGGAMWPQQSRVRQKGRCFLGFINAPFVPQKKRRKILEQFYSLSFLVCAKLCILRGTHSHKVLHATTWPSDLRKYPTFHRMKLTPFYVINVVFDPHFNLKILQPKKIHLRKYPTFHRMKLAPFYVINGTSVLGIVAMKCCQNLFSLVVTELFATVN